MQGFVRKGITLLSPRDPVLRCEKVAEAVAIKDRTLYFCPSPIFGYGLDRFLSRLEAEAPNSAALCVEADAELYELAIKNIDASITGNSKLLILSVNADNNINEAARLRSFIIARWGEMAFRRVETVRFTGGWQLFAQFYDFLDDALRREIAVDLSNTMTLTRLGRLYIRNALRNISLISVLPSVDTLSFGSSPVLVLGAGPSLDFTLDALERRLGKSFLEAEDRPFRIVCVDTCLGTLKDRNIVPDLVVILESQHWNLRDFIGVKDWAVSYAVDLSALPQSSRELGGKGFIFMTPWTRLKILERLKKTDLLPAVVPPLGSVGLSAVEITRRLSGGNMILCGFDFSFTIDKYYARSAPGHRDRLNSQTRLRGIINGAVFNSSSRAESKSGFPVLSNPIMRNYRDLFEREFGGDPRIFDVEGSGLPLGVKTLSAEEAISILTNGSGFPQCGRVEKNNQNRNASDLIPFLRSEAKLLKDLRDILTGEAAMDKERLDALVDECDYLWAHFPDCAGGRRPDLTSGAALSFLKRVRTEIDPMLRLLEPQQ